MFYLCLLRFIAISVLIGNSIALENDQVFTQCGGKFSAPNGVIHSPNYPNPFPTPIYCEWVINAPSDKKIILYFTQFFLRGSFDVLEYKFYRDFTTYIDERKLATVNCEDEIPYIVSYKPYLVLRFAVHEMGNIHMRVLDHIVDVFGFNITYEMVNEKEEVKTACSVHYCSYLGNCIANADFSSYKCHCFPGYFGDECHYGPHCDPPRENMCFNGGKCRYFLGTYVNTCECPDGYSGFKCEQPPVSYQDELCVSLGCSQQCQATEDKDGNGKCENGKRLTQDNRAFCGYCTCDEGYRLTENNRTCLHIERYRVTLTVFPTTKTANTDKISVADLKAEIFRKLRASGITTADKFGILNIRNSSRQPKYRFYFYIERPDLTFLDDVVQHLVTSKRLGTFNLSSTRPFYKTEPEFYLQSVSTSAGDSKIIAAKQGTILTLWCAARGSENIRFQWFKQGYPINTSLTDREIYTSVVISRSEEITRSILSLDSVTPYDRGEFTCHASDYGEFQNKSIKVDVITLPLVDLDPLSSSVKSGEKVSVRCMSPDDTQRTFLNEWFEGTAKIPPGHRKDRIVEDLFPTGTRLFIPSLTHSATFTCRVTNSAGSVNVTSHIFVPEANETHLECPGEFFQQVIWRKTAGRHFDKQSCPTDSGYATRRCECAHGAEKCHWDAPNFVRCQSLALVKIFDELEEIMLGYQEKTMKTVYDHLNDFFNKDVKRLFTGDYEIAVNILEKFLSHLSTFQSLATKDRPLNVTSILKLMDYLLTGAINATTEEKTEMKAGSDFLKMADHLAGGLTDALDFTVEKSISLENLDMNIKTTYLLEDVELHRYFPRLSLTRNKRHITYDDFGDEDIRILEFTFHNISSLLSSRSAEPEFSYELPEKFFRSTQIEHISNIHSLYSFKNRNITTEDGILYVDVPISHMMKVDTNDVNETLCLVWKFNMRESEKGSWQKQICSLVQFEDTYSVCRCPIPGHVVVGVIPINRLMTAIKSNDILSMYIQIGCIILMCGVISVLVVLLYNWRKLNGDEYVIHLNFLIALIAINVVFFVCLQYPMNEVICIAGQMLAHFLFLAAEAFVFVEAIHIYIITTKQSPSKSRIVKYMGIGWGIPSLITVIIFVASALTGYSKVFTKICWVSRDQWQFYGYIVPMTILTMTYIVFICLSLKTCLTWKEELRISNKRKIVSSIAKTGVLLVLLIIFSLVSTSLYGDNQQGQGIALLCVQIALAIYIFVSNILLDEKVLSIVWQQRTSVKEVEYEVTETNETLKSSSSFRAFIKPERVEDDDLGKETESVNKYYDRINRLKFTNERKRHLSTLLGSSASGNHMNNYIGNYGYRQQDVDSDNNGTDSGIFVGSDHDKSDKCSFDEPAELVQITSHNTTAESYDYHGRLGSIQSGPDDVFEEFQETAILNNYKEGSTVHGMNGCVIPIVVKTKDNYKDQHKNNSGRHRRSSGDDNEETFALIHSNSYSSEEK